MSAAETPVAMDLSRFPYLTGNYAPVAMESTFGPEALRVTGRVPEALTGAYMRNGPNVAFAPNHYVYPLDGDGMIHAVYFAGGQVCYRNRWVRTRALEAERKFGRTIYGSIGRPLPVPPEVIEAGGDPSPYKNTANTNVILHGGKLLALWEVGLPHLLTPGLDTVGLYTYEGALRPDQNLTAHPKICPVTGELVSCTQPRAEAKWIAMIFGPDGVFRRRISVDLPYKAVLHDLQITERHIVLLCGPAISNPALAAQGKLPVEWRPSEPMRIAVIPRDGTAPVRWIETDPFFSWHFCNGYERGGTLVVDFVWIASIPIAAEQGTGIEAQPRRMHRLTIDLAGGTVRNERVSELFCEFARADDRRCGLPYRYGYAAVNTMAQKGEQHGYNCTARFDFETGEAQLFEHGPAANAGEPVCVPKPGGRGELDAYVMTFATNPGEGSYLAIFDAAGLADGPIAKVHIPTRVPNGFHANWMEGLAP